MRAAIPEMTKLTTKLAMGAVALLLVASCSSALDNRNKQIEELNKESQQIAAREKQCIETATKRANDQLSEIEKARDDKSGPQILAINQERSQEVSQCEIEADQTNEALAAREQAEYEREAQEEHQRATMLSVIASQPAWH
jgi:hypothetical protein